MTRSTLSKTGWRLQRARLSRWGAVLASAASLTAVGGCAGLFSIDVPPLKARSNGAGAGGEGVAGAGLSGSDAGPGAGGGGFGGSARGGTSSAGRGGRAATNTAAAGGTRENPGGGGETAGAAGEPEASFPDEGTPCPREGAVACVAPASFETRRCEGGKWRAGNECAAGEYCDRRTGACGAAYPGCSTDARGVCSDDHHAFAACGPDLVTAELETCVFDCRDDEGCTPPRQGELALEKPPASGNAGAFWPGPRVPVCFTCAPGGSILCDPGGGFDDWRGVVRDEIERTWGHDAGIGFEGWDSCGDGAGGVKVELHDSLDKCEGELGGTDRIGYPGPEGSVNVRLCLGYFDADGHGRNTSEALLRLVARHEFGHVLGFDDVSAVVTSTEFMAPGISWSSDADFTQFPFTYPHVWPLQLGYGFKPSGAFVNAHGLCLTASGVSPPWADCDGSEPQVFDFWNDQLRNEAAETCVRTDTTSGAVSLAACAPEGTTPEQLFFRPSVNDLFVRGYGDLCLFDLYTREIVAGRCHRENPAQTQYVLLVDGGRRVRLQDTTHDLCLTLAESSETKGDVALTFVECDACADVYPGCDFEFTAAGQLAIDGRCLAVPSSDATATAWSPPTSGAIEAVPCSTEPRMAWSLTGNLLGGADVFDYYGRTE